MTIEERKDRFSKFHGCVGVACSECSYKISYSSFDCREAIYEDATAILKDMADKNLEDGINKIVSENTPRYSAPLTNNEKEMIREIIRVKTDVADLSAHFIQEINELCAELNYLAAAIGKLEQITKGTDPAGKDESDDELVEAINAIVARAVSEAADVFNYLWALGYEDKFDEFLPASEEKLARWANRLNGVSDE